MSISREEKIACAACGTQQGFTVWSSVNVSVDPSLKEPLLDGRLTTFECIRCANTAHVAYDVLYHDMDRSFAVWLKYPEDNETFGIEEPAQDLFSLLSDGYVCRLVPSFQELVEKVRILDDGFDDYAIELLKLLICIREEIDITYPLYCHTTDRSLLGGRSIVFVLPTGDEFIEKRYSVRKQLEPLQPILAKITLSQSETDDRWPYVDRQHLLLKVKTAGLMRQIR